MLIEGSKTLPAPRDVVWRALNDPAFLQRTLPDCRALAQRGADEFVATLVTGIGPIRASFDVAFRREGVEAGRGYTLVGEGSAGAAGSAAGQAQVLLEDLDGGTLLRYSADTAVQGKLAQLGARMIDGAARKFSERFFHNIQQALLAGSEASALAPAGGVHVSTAGDIVASARTARAAAMSGWLLPVACGLGCFAGTLAAGLLR